MEHDVSRIDALTIQVEEDHLDGGFVSEVLEIPGARSQGDTIEEAAHNAIDAALCVLADRLTGTEPERYDGHGTYRLALA